jgi:hypothetical protein
MNLLARTRDLVLVAVVALLCAGTMLLAFQTGWIPPSVENHPATPADDHVPRPCLNGRLCSGPHADLVATQTRQRLAAARATQISQALSRSPAASVSSSGEDLRAYLGNMSRAARDGNSIGIGGGVATPDWLGDDRKSSQ